MKNQLHHISVEAIKMKPKYVDAVTRATLQEDNDLYNSIKQKGIETPLIVNEKYIILDGHRRFTKAVNLGIKFVYVIIKKFKNLDEEYRFVCETNLNRRNMNEAQKIFNSQELFKIETKLAKQRQKSLAATRGKKGTLASKDTKGKTAGKVAKIIGTSQATYEKGQAIIKSGDKKLIDSWLDGKKTSTAYGEVLFYKTLKRSPPLPKGIWNCIVIDLPIEYDNKTGGSMTSGSKSKYPTITWEQAFTKTTLFKKIIADDAMCFIWATTPHGKKYQEFLEKLGFKYSTKHYWIKTYKGDQMGIGYTFRGAVEELLVGYKGKARASRLQEANYFILPATKHSEKPIKYYDLIERAVVKSIPKPKVIELYNRKPRYATRFAWTFYGYDELEKKAILK